MSPLTEIFMKKSALSLNLETLRTLNPVTVTELKAVNGAGCFCGCQPQQGNSYTTGPNVKIVD